LRLVEPVGGDDDRCAAVRDGEPLEGTLGDEGRDCSADPRDSSREAPVLDDASLGEYAPRPHGAE
jgi:hypothetical protein